MKKSEKKPHTVSFRVTKDQYNLARRRLFVEDLNWQTVMRALLNAYIMGDVSVTSEGRYHIAPPSGYVPVVEVTKEEDVVEIEPDWGTTSERPQVGANHSRQHPRNHPVWGTRELAAYLRRETGRRVTVQVLRKLLTLLEVPKADNGFWQFDGEDDKHVSTIIEAITDGTYATLVKEGVVNAQKHVEKKEDRALDSEELEEARSRNAKINHLKRVRRIS